ALIYVLWAIYGYSVAFTGGNAFMGGFSKIFLSGITPDSVAATFSKGVVIPELSFVSFQATFAAITCALIVGAFAERMKFAALLWVGWFGFNAGSNLEATGTAALAFANTLFATAAATLAWIAGEALSKGKASMLGAASGAVAGLVAITPACGFVGVMGSIVI